MHVISNEKDNILDGLCTVPSYYHFLQVDLFFYREPEEAKEEEQEEAPALDYADYGAAAIGGDWSTAQIPEAQWAPDLAGAAAPVADGWAAAETGYPFFNDIVDSLP